MMLRHSALVPTLVSALVSALVLSFASCNASHSVVVTPSVTPPLDVLETKVPPACLVESSPLSRANASSDTGSARALDRAAFWWSLRGHHYSIPRVLASAPRRRALLSRLLQYHITRLYTFAQPYLSGYKARRLRRWHRVLHDAQIQTYLLVGSPVWACDPAEFFTLLRGRFADFQSGSKALEGFDGVYLDIEPHALHAQDERCLYHWDRLTAPQKRGLLYRLLQIVIDTQALLTEHATHTLKLGVYLPVWLDNLHTPDSIWASAKQRDQFYLCLRRFSHEVTVAAYCRKGAERITASLTAEERLLESQLRVGLNVYHRRESAEVCQTWGSLDDIWGAERRVRELIKSQPGFDFENLTRLLED